MRIDRMLTAVCAGVLLGTTILAQTPAPTAGAGGAAGRQAGPGRGGPAVVSPQILADGRVTFRILAPQATRVTVTGDVNGGLVPAPAGAAATTGQPGGTTSAATMEKSAGGVWEGTTIRAMRPGAWRYNFNVDGVVTVDSRNTRTSPNQSTVQSLLVVPGDFSETRNVPHGAVASVRYVARALGGTTREMFVYTPPGYEKGTASYPVLYLIHGGGDTAVSWSTVGRAGDIIDNLLADKRALPMIVVMPSGWTPSGGQVMTSDARKDPFNAEMIEDIIPYIDTNYRTLATAEHRALSGLSMGGIQTLNVGLHNLGTFRYLAVMSSGWTSDADREAFYAREAARIPTYDRELKLFWWGWGETDIARANGLAVIEKFRELGVKNQQTLETPGGHTWDNWRLYLHDVAPRLFR
jgi:enterochelin esterase-like enzyme